MDCHTRWIRLLIALSMLPAAATASSTIAHLSNVQINAAKVDASGNIYLAGQTTTSAGSTVVYIAKLSPDGATVYAVTIGGSGGATALDIDSAGAVYVAGTTSPAGAAFAAKLDAKGNILYSAPIGGTPNAQPRSAVVNSKGELVVSGQFTPGVPLPGVPVPFLLKVSADGSQIVAGPQGIGGLVALDAQDNIYLAGVAPTPINDPPATPGAFQGVPAVTYCGCPMLNFACGDDQFVASLTADLSRTRFLTYVTAKHGAVPAYAAVDSQGNVLVAGTTNAPGYPTTANSYQPNYTATTGTVLTCGPPVPMEVVSPSGYVTLVKADGPGLIFSTFLSGTKSDHISFAAMTSAGIYLAGQAGSADLPGFNGAVPSQCVPVGFVTRMALDGSAISSSRTPPGTPVAYDATSGTLLLASGNDLVRVGPSVPTPIACVLDAADLSPVTAIAPGELLAMFGRFLYYGDNVFASTVSPVNGSFPVKFQGLNVAAGQTPAPLLYVSPQQVNFQAPYEIAGNAQTQVTVTYSDVNGDSISDWRSLGVAASNPVAFLSQPSLVNQAFPLALNADGTANSSTNPASAGSVVTIFIGGLGLTNPAPITGLVNTSPLVPLNLPLAVTPYCVGSYCNAAPTFVSAGSATGSISGVTQVQLRTPANPRPGTSFPVIFSLSAARDTNLSFWVE